MDAAGLYAFLARDDAKLQTPGVGGETITWRALDTTATGTFDRDFGESMNKTYAGDTGSLLAVVNLIGMASVNITEEQRMLYGTEVPIDFTGVVSSLELHRKGLTQLTSSIPSGATPIILGDLLNNGAQYAVKMDADAMVRHRLENYYVERILPIHQRGPVVLRVQILAVKNQTAERPGAR